MRNYDCYFAAKIKNRWEKIERYACWAGINAYGSSLTLKIDEWKDKSTKKYAKLLTSVINEITPCKISRGYIHYTLIENGIRYNYYDRNLILLNFIRYLWHNYGDSVVFFKALEESKEEDPFRRLSEANLKNNIFYKEEEARRGNLWIYPNPGHSNIDTRQKSLISLETFLNYTGNCTGFFNR